VDASSAFGNDILKQVKLLVEDSYCAAPVCVHMKWNLITLAIVQETSSDKVFLRIETLYFVVSCFQLIHSLCERLERAPSFKMLYAAGCVVAFDTLVPFIGWKHRI